MNGLEVMRWRAMREGVRWGQAREGLGLSIAHGLGEVEEALFAFGLEVQEYDFLDGLANNLLDGVGVSAAL